MAESEPQQIPVAENADAAENEPVITPQIIITFKALHNTDLEIALRYVDAAQIELAGHFLQRHAEQQYAIAQAAQQVRGLVAAPPGLKV